VKPETGDNRPIAIFDSGLGGLSVVRHLRQILPHEDMVYFGDTARVPYGSKSRRTVISFALDDARYLLQFDPKLVVVACNTASALALDELSAHLPVPVVGVVRPGAKAAVRLAAGSAIAILGTEATVASGAYPREIRVAGGNGDVIQKSCPLLVPLVEEGRADDDPIVSLTIETYLAPLRERGIAVAVLGCTHYPLLRGAIDRCLGPAVQIVDSGRETSLAVHAELQAADALSRRGEAGTLRCFVSDNPARFMQIGSRFLAHSIESVDLVEPEMYVRQPETA
jgi:glutamate racemase